MVHHNCFHQALLLLREEEFLEESKRRLAEVEMTIAMLGSLQQINKSYQTWNAYDAKYSSGSSSDLSIKISPAPNATPREYIKRVESYRLLHNQRSHPLMVCRENAHF